MSMSNARGPHVSLNVRLPDSAISTRVGMFPSPASRQTIDKLVFDLRKLRCVHPRSDILHAAMQVLVDEKFPHPDQQALRDAIRKKIFD